MSMSSKRNFENFQTYVYIDIDRYIDGEKTKGSNNKIWLFWAETHFHWHNELNMTRESVNETLFTLGQSWKLGVKPKARLWRAKTRIIRI